MQFEDNGNLYHVFIWSQARPSLEREDVTGILDANLLSQPCNMEVMLKMGQLALKCVVKSPKQRPTMTQVWQELEEAIRLADGNSPKPAAGGGPRKSRDCYASQSFSIDGVGYQRFPCGNGQSLVPVRELEVFGRQQPQHRHWQSSLRGIAEEKYSRVALSWEHLASRIQSYQIFLM